MTLVASDVLIEIAEKLRRAQTMTALDVYKLHQITQALANTLGYQDAKDTGIYFDAVMELSREQREEKDQR